MRNGLFVRISDKKVKSQSCLDFRIPRSILRRHLKQLFLKYIDWNGRTFWIPINYLERRENSPRSSISKKVNKIENKLSPRIRRVVIISRYLFQEFLLDDFPFSFVSIRLCHVIKMFLIKRKYHRLNDGPDKGLDERKQCVKWNQNISPNL